MEYCRPSAAATRCVIKGSTGWPLLPLPPTAVANSATYPACSSDSDCYNQTLYRCVGCRHNASEPAGVCFGTSGKATCQCKASAPGDQCGPANFKPDPASKLPTYLMVGDSISIGMVHDGNLFSTLNASVQPTHSPGNACNANRGAHCIRNWLDGCAFDVVSFNFGIHDISHNQEHMTLPVYQKMLGAATDALLECRKQKATKLIYILTTPVPTDGGNASSLPSHCANADVVRYNTAASAIMAAAKIPTVDMYSFVNQHCGLNYETCDFSARKGNVHFTPLGFTALAGRMATAIKRIVAS